MTDDGRTTSEEPNEWRIKLSSAVGGGLGAAIALVCYPEFGNFWLGLLAFIATLVGGGVLGRLLGLKVFRKLPTGQ